MRGIRKFLITTTVAMALGLLGLPPNLRADNGALKVTSFPSGANVFVDSVDTGKVTPMTVSEPVGTHTITVSLGPASCQDPASSGWTPATHTMEVIQGTNFLSVTLLPCLTVGPQGPAGPQGLPGLPGTAATVTVDRTTTVAPGTPASVINSGTSSAAVLNFTIPQGVPGLPGTAATVAVGTITTGAPGSNANVTDTGTASAAVLNFTIPQGAKGDTGATGASGAAGTAATVAVSTTTTGAPGSNANVTDTGTANAAVLNFTIPQGVPGPQGPSGPTGPTGPGLTSRREFRDSGTFTVPPGITRLSVELYGAGGAASGLASPCFSGAGGGSGAYSSTILPVQGSQLLTITVGLGGAPGSAGASPGVNGGDTQVLDASGTPLAVAHGGSGVLFTPCGPLPTGGLGGAVDPNAPNPMINHPGAPGGAGSTNQGAPGRGGMGYVLPGFFFQANGQFGAGGDGGSTSPTGNVNGSPGQGGYILLSW